MGSIAFSVPPGFSTPSNSQASVGRLGFLKGFRSLQAQRPPGSRAPCIVLVVKARSRAKMCLKSGP